MTDPTDARMYNAIEAALWQNLADALNQLSEYGLDPIAGLCEQLGHKPTDAVDAGDVIHGGAVREPVEGYLLRYQPPFALGPNGEDLPFGWVVAARADEAEGPKS